MSNPVVVELRPLGRQIEVVSGTPLADALVGLGVEFPCGGRGRCGRCRVRVLDGTLAASPDERQILTPEAVAHGWRLACRSTVAADVTIEIESWSAPVLIDDTRLEITARPGRGVAVDLGTTTLVAQLVDLTTGELLAVETARNPQSVHGSDLMTRMEAALEGGGPELARLIREKVGQMIAELLTTAGPGPDLAEILIVGNTVMGHLFCELDVAPLARVPFEPDECGEQVLAPADVGWDLPGAPPVRFGPSIGGFVGSDLAAGILATRLGEQDELCALVDLGTNGEIVLGNREQLLCASTAAGPAFEAGGIAMGMQATAGAINEVRAESGRLVSHVLGGTRAQGICGSGLVDAVAAGLDLELIEPSGRLAGGRAPIELSDGVAITQSDIRQLQLAKGAIAAGLRILLGNWAHPGTELSRIYLAGAFGNYVSRSSARRIGLLDAGVERIEPAGNTALLGAKLSLFAGDRSDILVAASSRTRHISLAADPDFQERFVDEMGFPTC